MGVFDVGRSYATSFVGRQMNPKQVVRISLIESN